MRPIRLNVVGVTYHVIARFVNREWFLNSDDERERYLTLLGRSLDDSDWRCFAYALMSSHVHLELIAGVTPMSEWLRPVHSPFATWTNRRCDRVGAVFMRGPRDFALMPDKEAAVLAYIHNNPVRADVVRRAAESTWTSHRAYIGLVRPPKWLHVEEGLKRARIATSDFDAWVNTTPGERGDPEPLPRGAVKRRGGLEIATPSAIEHPIVARPYAHVRPAPRTVIQAVAELTGIAADNLCSHQRNPRTVEGRRLVVHCARALGLTFSEIAAALGIGPEGARYLAQRELSRSAERQRVLVCERIRMQMQLDPALFFQFGQR